MKNNTEITSVEIIDNTKSVTTEVLEKPKKKTRVAEVSRLQSEKEKYESFHNKQKPKRSRSYRPTLKEFQSTPFEEYIRKTLLGVNCSCCKKKPVGLCQSLYQDGIAKITPPAGWWDYESVGNDLTGRGPAWQANTPLGDLKLTSPIKQHASGMAGVYEFTMMVLPDMTLSEFREKADAYRTRQLRSFEPDFDEDNLDEIAIKFWKKLGPVMQPPLYGADLEGSLFNNAHASGWNVAKLSSCIKLLAADAPLAEHGFHLPGVTTAYLYAGMFGSVFAVHTEDLNLLSINYLHAGAPKYWYSIVMDDLKRFESLAISHFAAVSKACPDFLRHKRYVLSPSILKKAGIRFVTQIQQPGEIMITFPGSYHFGFNTGFNMAESTNFAIPEWVDIGKQAGICLCQPHSVRFDIYRFETLLREYQTYNKNSLDYLEWALERASQIRESRAVSDENSSDCASSCDEKDMIVPLFMTSPDMSANKRKKSPSKNKQEFGRAIRAKSISFKNNTKVICRLPAKDGKSMNFYSGIVKSEYENYVRIHFHGMLKKDDLWIERGSNNIWLNGGMTEQVALIEKKSKKRKLKFT